MSSLLDFSKAPGMPEQGPDGALELGKLYDKIAPEFYTLALHVTHCPDQAEELVQDVFLDALERTNQGDPRAADEKRLAELLYERLEDWSPREPMEDVHGLEAIPSTWTPLGDLERAELRSRLDRALDQLPDAIREVVELKIVYQRNSRQIGEQVQRSAATVRSQLARGLDRLRLLLPSALGLYVAVSLPRTSLAGPSASAGTLEFLRRRVLEKARGWSASQAGELTRYGLLQSPWLWMAVAGIGLLLGREIWPGGEPVGPKAFASELSETSQGDRASLTAGALVPQERALRTSLEETQALGAAAELAHIHGKIVGPRGQILPGVTLSLFTWREWDSKGTAPKLQESMGYGWQTTSDSEGGFAFSVPL
ncbi:MAG: sigma-70 family RNA polymerase sigma factor, partial [Planctomycetes bacterium]|nr:sigma-70 family RNA polymerase sigma factor [Planctomycetota bacterium]